MRFGKGLSTLKNCTLGEGKHNKEMEDNNAIRKRYIRKETWKTEEQKRKIQKQK
tara:strand:- start:317 stop:478 length:162 start_codon:yes stop_codon:yes gene_type:complete